jgi:hypothetical protein
MLGIDVRSNAKAIIAEIDGLLYGGQRRAIARALNRAADGVQTDASREIRGIYKLKKATVDKAFSVKRATPDNHVAVVTVRGRPLSLAGFGARQTKKGVTVNVKGTRKLIPGAFIQRLKDARGDEYEVVFIRQGASRYPIKALKTIDVPGVFSRDEILQAVDAAAFRRFEIELPRQIAYLLKLQNG